MVGGELSTVGNHDIDNRFVRIARFGRFNHLNTFHAFDDIPKNDMMFVIQMRRGGGGDKIRAWTGIGHRLMSHLEIFIRRHMHMKPTDLFE